MENLIEKIAAYIVATEELLNKTRKYEDFVKREIPFELWEHFGLGPLGRKDREWHIVIWRGGETLIPASTKDFGKGFYYGGDYNCWYNYCTSMELLAWAKELPKLIKKAEEDILTLTQQTEDLNKQINI